MYKRTGRPKSQDYMNNTTTPSAGSGFLKSSRPILFLFIFLNAGLAASRSLLSKWNTDYEVVLWGNIILVAATLASFYFYYRSLRSQQGYGFLNQIYMGIFVKMMVCLLAAFLYIYVAGKSANKPAVIVCLALYLVYTVVEMSQLTKISKSKKNV